MLTITLAAEIGSQHLGTEGWNPRKPSDLSATAILTNAPAFMELFAFRLINAVPIRRGRIMAEGLDAFGVHMIKRADAEAFSSLAARFDCVQCLRPILLAVIPQHLGRELVQF